jgi:hypothetical protein
MQLARAEGGGDADDVARRDSARIRLWHDLSFLADMHVRDGALDDFRADDERQLPAHVRIRGRLGAPGRYQASRNTTTSEIAGIERRQSDDLIGLSLEEAKSMTGAVQRAMVEAQARAAIDRGSICPECQASFDETGHTGFVTEHHLADLTWTAQDFIAVTVR